MSEQAENRKSDGSNLVSPQASSQQPEFPFPFHIPSALQHPGNVLLLTSVPLFAGAFVGYKLPALQSLEDMVGEKNNTKAKRTAGASDAIATAELHPDEARALASRMAVRAFRIATFGTVATFGVLGAAVFHLSGYQTMEEAVKGTRVWATSIRESLERFFGTAERREQQLAQHPDMVATKNMTEEQEMTYLYNKYMALPAEQDQTEDVGSDKDANPTKPQQIHEPKG